ncbi:MAG: RDD family protein [Hyphomicrobiales bacterium]|nr:MAG: RDD family protein [Hyphomicrobiales bacterium]
MSNIGSSPLPDPATAPQLFDGVLTRRSTAFVIDLAMLALIVAGICLVGFIAGFFSFGVAWLVLPIVVPLAILSYYAGTLGGRNRATVGMSMMDLVLVPTRGYPLDGWKILIHPIVFWVTVWVAWPVSLLIALFTPRRQMVQDLVTGTLMLRRSPMVRHWGGQRA